MFSCSVSCRDQAVKNTWVGFSAPSAAARLSGEPRSAATDRTPWIAAPPRVRARTSQPVPARRLTSAEPAMPLAPTTSAVRPWPRSEWCTVFLLVAGGDPFHPRPDRAPAVTRPADHGPGVGGYAE